MFTGQAGIETAGLVAVRRPFLDIENVKSDNGLVSKAVHGWTAGQAQTFAASLDGRSCQFDFDQGDPGLPTFVRHLPKQ